MAPALAKQHALSRVNGFFASTRAVFSEHRLEDLYGHPRFVNELKQCIENWESPGHAFPALLPFRQMCRGDSMQQQFVESQNLRAMSALLALLGRCREEELTVTYSRMVNWTIEVLALAHSFPGQLVVPPVALTFPGSSNVFSLLVTRALSEDASKKDASRVLIIMCIGHFTGLDSYPHSAVDLFHAILRNSNQGTGGHSFIAMVELTAAPVHARELVINGMLTRLFRHVAADRAVCASLPGLIERGLQRLAQRGEEFGSLDEAERFWTNVDGFWALRSACVTTPHSPLNSLPLGLMRLVASLLL
jgi:hypothetical protein